FVVGSSNRFAHAAAQAVAATPGAAYNPLFIYGNSGLGKTHLLCAISNEIKSKNPNVDIIFTRGEEFVSLIVEGIKAKTMQEIHNKYRNCDILIVDDIQFIAGKESTQEEFFHTFNALTQDGKQIVLASDRAPKDIEILDERLRNRFEWGLIADIQPPDIETRMAIIQRKAKTLGLELPADVIQFVAEKIKTNIRQLEGAVKKINALVNIEGSSINIAMAQNAIRDIMSDSRPVSAIVNNIIAETSRTFGVPQADIISKKKDAKTARARQVAIYIVREITDLTQKEISEFFGGRDRTTILYSVETVAKDAEKDSSLKKTIDKIIKNVQEQ
ncbi:MAG: chromosomal replication initiator protein DnaA, partial [Clostridia bacterium]|nr:chromosomal replication initiator protein DnaA [Clostridia bacterium]